MKFEQLKNIKLFQDFDLILEENSEEKKKLFDENGILLISVGVMTFSMTKLSISISISISINTMVLSITVST
jgi:hypothetical protein